MMNAMGQVATLSDKLALMPDNMLPRLAQQYKGDAITLSLILGEKNRRDRVRNTLKAEAGAQPQPKVNDQVVSEMQMPEEVGIGALPAPNMQRMADGGIAGYADGDLVAQNEPVLRMAEGGVARYAPGGLSQDNPAAMSALVPLQQAVLSAKQMYEAAARSGDQQAASTYLRALSEAQQRLSEAAKNSFAGSAPQALLETQAASVTPAYSNEGRRAPTANTGPTPAAPVAGTTGTGGLADLSVAPAAAKPAAAAAPAAPKVGDIKAQFLKDAESMAPKTEKAEDYMARRKALLGEEGQALSKYEAKLLAQEAAAPGEKDQAFWMAVTQAGLAAAAGKSANALQNIAEGFGTGVAGYKDALKDFKKAEQERTKAMAEIEQARRAEKRGDVDAAMAHQDKSETRMDNFNHYKLSGLASLAGHEVSGQYQLAASKISAGAAGAAQRQLLEDLGRAAPDSALRKGYELMHPTDRPEMAFAQLYAKHVEEARKTMTEPMTPTQFAATMRGAITAFKPKVVDTATPSGPVYDR